MFAGASASMAVFGPLPKKPAFITVSRSPFAGSGDEILKITSPTIVSSPAPGAIFDERSLPCRTAPFKDNVKVVKLNIRGAPNDTVTT